jgi:hypothetical protein
MLLFFSISGGIYVEDQPQGFTKNAREVLILSPNDTSKIYSQSALDLGFYCLKVLAVPPMAFVLAIDPLFPRVRIIKPPFPRAQYFVSRGWRNHKRQAQLKRVSPGTA